MHAQWREPEAWCLRDARTLQLVHLRNDKLNGPLHVHHEPTWPLVKTVSLNNKLITNWVKLKNKQFHSKVLLSSFPMNCPTSGFCIIRKLFIKWLTKKKFQIIRQHIACMFLGETRKISLRRIDRLLGNWLCDLLLY